MILLKIPHLLRCIRAEGLKLKGVDCDSSLTFDPLADFSTLHFGLFERNQESIIVTTA
jgi:hypothetical protein